MSRCWELFGQVRKAVLALLTTRRDNLDEASRYVKSLGAKSMAKAEGGLFVSIAAEFPDPPDPKVWKPVKDSPGMYEPRRTSKEGRAISDRFKELARAVPTADRVGGVIGMGLFLDDGCWHTPGVAVRGRRVFVKTPDSYEPSGKLRDQMKRVSDLVYEKAVG